MGRWFWLHQFQVIAYPLLFLVKNTNQYGILNKDIKTICESNFRIQNNNNDNSMAVENLEVMLLIENEIVTTSE